jgi:diaminohydroxyphosphoribosylaminopyrimidine deaminase/5-amino-6-(5-phosphoribosylamino)uracil reductase
LAAAGIARVIYAARDPHLGKGGEERLRAAGIEVQGGVLAAEAERLNEPWLHWEETGRPFLHLKVAQTLSGHVTRGGGRDRWISGPEARGEVHRLRRRHRAVLVGAGTALADDPLLTVRDWPPPGEPGPAWPDVQPLRVVLDSRLRLPPASHLAASAGPDRPVLVLCAEAAPEEREAALAAAGVEVARLPASSAGVDLEAAIGELAARQVTGVLVEPGPTLAAALLGAGLADRWTAFLAPDADVADDALALYAPAGPVRLPPLADVEVARHGRDVAVTGRPRGPG